MKPAADSADPPALANPPARRPGLAAYVALLVVAALLALGYKLRTNSILACAASGYSSDDFLGYCNVTGYGDYDHGAFWYGLEPQATAHAAAADAVFLGSSRMQFGFSSPATADWFRARQLRHYLFGFSHTETVRFMAPLLERTPLKARAYVINVDRFFDARLSPPFETLQAASDGPARYVERRRWQAVHQALCGRWPALCGQDLAFFRSRSDGAWHATGTERLERGGVADHPQESPAQWAGFIDLARRFVARLPVDRSCVVLTLVPNGATRRAEATAIAQALGLELVAPTPAGLSTFDGSHLDAASAQRWSEAFFAAAGPRLEACLAQRG